jgi:acyl dehydratase
VPAALDGQDAAGASFGRRNAEGAGEMRTGKDVRKEPFGPQRYFEDFELGEAFYIPSRTVTEAQFLAFQAASGDNHPIHYDRVYCKAHGHRDLLAHGYQVAIQTAAGAGIFPFLVQESLRAFIEQSTRFLAPVYAGDTLYPLLEVAALEPQRTTGVLTMRSTIHNQDDVLVLEGTQRYLLRKRHP